MRQRRRSRRSGNHWQSIRRGNDSARSAVARCAGRRAGADVRRPTANVCPHAGSVHGLVHALLCRSARCKTSLIFCSWAQYHMPPHTRAHMRAQSSAHTHMHTHTRMRAHAHAYAHARIKHMCVRMRARRAIPVAVRSSSARGGWLFQ